VALINSTTDTQKICRR